MIVPSNMKFFPLKIQERLSGRRVNRAIKDNLSSSIPNNVAIIQKRYSNEAKNCSKLRKNWKFNAIF